MKENIITHTFGVSQQDRNKQNNHNSFVLWFTGLSGSGKSTLANEVERALIKLSVRTYILDGDNIRQGLNKNLSFSPEDRGENIRRIAEVSKLMIDAGIVVLAAFVSPYIKDRENIKKIIGDSQYIEIYVNTPIAVCESRDVKGLYKKARAGEIANFTGVNAPYEPSENPDIEIDTSKQSSQKTVDEVIEFVKNKLILTHE